MPYDAHPEIATPGDDTVLWRYMDFAQFIHTLSTKSLWFARQDQFEDPLEGTFTDAEFESMEKRPHGRTIRKRGPEFMRSTVFVNCWRSGRHESIAMWDLYGKGSGIVAIKTTIALMKTALKDFVRPVYIANVAYVDWAGLLSEGWNLPNGLAMCARKDISYQHEAEVRAMIWGHDLGLVSSPSEADAASKREETLVHRKEKAPLGLEVPFDCQRFVSEVVIGPREQQWVSGVVSSVMKMYGLTLPITISNRLKCRTGN